MDRGRSPNSVGPTAAGGGANNSNSNKRNKPCQQCQKLKVKCERNPSGGPCTRCASQNKECTYYEVPSKKRKKDPDEYSPKNNLSSKSHLLLRCFFAVVYFLF